MNSKTTDELRANREQVTAECIDQALKTVRQFLGLDVAFISEFEDTHRVIRHIDLKGEHSLFSLGQAIPLEDGYCLDVVEGRLPELIPDTSLNPLAASKPETLFFPIGAHVSVPIPLREGGLYGTLCCLNEKPVPTLGNRDLQVMKAVAHLIGSHLDSLLDGHREKDIRRLVIEAALEVGMPDIAYQPVIDLPTGRIVAAEALSRFSTEPLRTPDKWFADAADVGMDLELSEVALRHSLEGFEKGFEMGLCLGLNMSPSLACRLDLVEVFKDAPHRQVSIEITEHDIVDDYEALSAALAPARALGVRVAIDDMGAGYANIRHVLKMLPNCVKLDASLIKDIDRDPMKQAWLAGIMEFARRSSCYVLAEGVETVEELAVMKELGVRFGQGYLLGRPMHVEDLLRAADDGLGPRELL